MRATKSDWMRLFGGRAHTCRPFKEFVIAKLIGRQMLTMTLYVNSDQVRDAIRVQHIYSVLVTYPGNDHFAFRLVEGGKIFLVEFPSTSTGIYAELITRIQDDVAPGNFCLQPPFAFLGDYGQNGLTSSQTNKRF